MANHITTPPPSDYAWVGRVSPPGGLIHPPGKETRASIR
jgi:hypothetical protein